MARGSFQRKDYLVCTAGKWRQKSDQSNPNATARIYEDSSGKKKTVYELVDDYVSGVLKKIWIEEHPDYGRSWALQVHDGSDIMVLKVKFGSGYSSSLISKLANCDLSRPIMFIPYYFEQEHKSVMVLNQEGEKIESYFTKDKPNGFPKYPEDGDKDDVNVWKSQVNKFLKNFVEKNIIPKLPDADSLDTEERLANMDSKEFPIAPPPTTESFPDLDDAPPDEPDDLPF